MIEPPNRTLVRAPSDTMLARAAEIEERLRPAVEHAKRVMAESVARNTRVNYDRILRRFYAWCDLNGQAPVPATPFAVITYLSEDALKACKYATLRVILAAIKFDQQEHGFKLPPSADLDRFLKGERRLRGTAKTKKTASTAELTRRLVDTCASDDPVDVRDRALLLLLFGGAFRRSEIAQRTWDDVDWTDRELLVFLKRSKTDQYGAGQTVRVVTDPSSAYCPGKALRAWQECLVKLAGSAEGALFRSLKKRGYLSPLRDPVIAQIVKARAKAAGLDESGFSGHSMRRGYVTSHVRAGTPLDQIRVVTRHRTPAMIAEYTEETREIGKSLL